MQLLVTVEIYPVERGLSLNRKKGSGAISLCKLSAQELPEASKTSAKVS